MVIEAQKTLIYLVPYPLIPSHVEKFGFDIMREKGISFKVFELSAFAPNNHPNATYDCFLNEAYIQKILSLKEFEQCIKNTAASSVYIDSVSGLNGIVWNSRKIFRILKKYNAKFYVVETGSLPVFSTNKNHDTLMYKLFNKIKTVTDFSKLIQLIKSILMRVARKWLTIQVKYNNLYQLPTKIFSVDNAIVKQFLKRYQLPRETLVSIHSLDYDRYLSFVRSNVDIKTGEKLCVFIDQAMTHHPELSKEMGINRPVTHEKYIDSMTQFFNIIEQATGLRVIIAAHPSSHYELIPDAFGGREIVKYKTAELIAKSKLVLTHCSTAISYAILFNKPIALLVTQEMISTGYDQIVKNLAGPLGVEVVNVDALKSTEHHLMEQTNNSNTYSAYLYSYIKTKNIPDKMTWEFVADEFINTVARPF